jgi:hypothetical protein
VDGFSDVFANTLGYSEKNKMLFIGYRNGGLDIVHGSKIETVNALMEKGVDAITGFYPDGDLCYITHNKGISEYDMVRHEMAESYDEIWKALPCTTAVVNDITSLDDSLYAVSNLGVASTHKNEQFKKDCGRWNKLSTQSALFAVTFENRVVIAFANGSIKAFDGTSWTTLDTGSDRVYSLEVNHGKMIAAKGTNIIIWDNISTKNVHASNQRNHAIMDDRGDVWTAVNIYSLLGENFATGKTDFYRPNGPAHGSAYHLTSSGDEILVASGGLTEGGSNLFSNDGFYVFKDDEWINYTQETVQGWFVFKDIAGVARDPRNNHLWAGSIDSGLVEISGNSVVKFLNAANSCIQSTEYPAKTYGSVAALEFDKDNNLWIANYRAPNQLAVLPAKGGCYSFDLGPKKSARALVVDNNNNIWTTSPRENNLTVFTYGKTIQNANDGDEVKTMTVKEGEGHLPSESVFCLAKDREGQIWIGTLDGVAVFPDPGLVFSDYNFDAQRIWVENGDESGYLLSGEPVTAIAVDGGNRKWLGTRRGVWLTSPDGSKILANFTKENSPLISDLITSIAINGKTGEVFFGTDKGIVSYRSTATEGGDTHGDVYAFPNPVRPGYNGPIAITGLVTDAQVKITDITGKLVYETRAAGGEAIWYGKNFEGRDANSGVYLVFSTNKEGTETMVTKIMVVR